MTETERFKDTCALEFYAKYVAFLLCGNRTAGMVSSFVNGLLLRQLNDKRILTYRNNI